MSINTTDTPAMAADRELLRDVARRAERAGLRINVEELRTESLRLFVAKLILDGTITYADAEGYCLHQQVTALNRALRDHATQPH